jgi:ABC-type arginine/histidine transport system permease subunit
MDFYKILKGLLVTLAFLFISLCVVISIAITFVLKARTELNEKINSSLGIEK